MAGNNWRAKLFSHHNFGREDEFRALVNSPEVKAELPNVREWKHRENAFHMAVWCGSEKFVRMFLDAGVDVESRSVHEPMMNATAIHFAVFGTSLKMVKLLIDHGADPHVNGSLRKVI